MTLALALLPFLALLTAFSGPAVLPALGLLTAISVVTLHHLNPALDTGRILFVAFVALVISIVPVWRLGAYAEQSEPARIPAALSLSLTLSVGVCMNLSAGEIFPFLSGVPVNPSAITTALMIVFAGLATLAVRPGIKFQLAGLLSACDGILLAAADTAQTHVVWLLGIGILFLAGAGSWLAQRLSLLSITSNRYEHDNP
ncbi:hypothetical protein [Acetobacter oeni]|uniref:Uncharacterized protein n=1 Tax=Acetobacter oeni TaxID=304077 RepID=A0A511XGF9_9PROT|nr:hypothetical protein [Acetobacter oeni]MBB3881791.1 hypothetical protein [Acetobacter oeni]NHO17407.1 hypothetical protein [Acetobacter oeni]GEN62036.1 hypothetical protein AOE01nite_02600 [Acetobacter oeni]